LALMADWARGYLEALMAGAATAWFGCARPGERWMS
jgi:hypothetical protein